MYKVLVVGSSASDVAMFRGLLGEEGAEVEICRDGAAAKQVVADNADGFAAVFILWDVADLSFAETLALFRQRLPETPVVVMFEEELMAELAGRAVRLGARDVLSKPLKAERVKACWRELAAMIDTLPEQGRKGIKESSFDPRRTVLIGDTSKERFQLLEKILRDDFRLQALYFSNFTDLRTKVESDDSWLLVLIADGLPISSNKRTITLARYFISLEMRVPLGCLISDERIPDDLKLVGRGLKYLCISSAPAVDDLSLHEKIRIILQQLFGLPPIHPATRLELNLNPDDDRILREQIRSLSKHHDLNEGKEILKHLIFSFFDCSSATVERLGQGLSGARVFLLHIIGKKSYVLKISSDESRWKLEEEVRKHGLAMKYTGRPPLRVHLPTMQSCRNQKSEHIASYGSWAAVCYDYLGDKEIGGIIDLETLLIGSPEELDKKTSGTKLHDDLFASGKPLTKSRSDIFEGFLGWLCKEWCQNNRKIRRSAKQLWLTENCPPKSYPAVPPYRLKENEKGRITAFLGSKEAERVKQLMPNWVEHWEKVWDFVDKDTGATDLSALDNPVSVILSPAHGDLNANNVILWLEQPDHPLLIDFPFFQDSGHALQDIARLEIEIIYALMDCQAENSTSVQVREYDPSQLPLWLQLIDHLLDENVWKRKKQWKKRGTTDNIKHCLDLIQRLRQKAETVQAWQDKPTDHRPGFFAEYLPVLLYYTLREIGYPSRTVFKRLLAVYSASQTLTQLDRLSATRPRT